MANSSSHSNWYDNDKSGEIHIWDFPRDKIRVKLEPNYVWDLFQTGKSLLGGMSALVKRFQLNNRRSPYEWQNSKIFAPLSIVLELSKLINKT